MIVMFWKSTYSGNMCNLDPSFGYFYKIDSFISVNSSFIDFLSLKIPM